VNIIGERSQRLTRFARRAQREGRAKMKLAQLDAVLLEEGDRVLRFFELHRQVASVIVDTEVLGQARIVSVLGAHPIEKLSHFARGFQQTQRLGLKAEVKRAPDLRADAGDVLDATPVVVANDLQLL